MSPGVSFVVPVYNKAPYLPGVIDRIAAQRGDFERQYVFVDDGSTDGSLDILRRKTAGWDNVVIESQANAGSAAATNRGVALATLPFVKFVDADDLIASHATATLLGALEPSDAVLAYGRATYYTDEAALDLDGVVAAPAVERLVRPVAPTMTRSLFNPTQCLVRTEAVRRAGGCDERIVFSQEYTLAMRLAVIGDFLRVDAPVAFLPADVAGRLSNDRGRQLQRVTRAVAYFMDDHPELPWSLKQRMCRRSAGRAWKYARRVEGETWLTSAAFWRQARAFLPVLDDHAGFVERCAASFDDLRRGSSEGGA